MKKYLQKIFIYFLLLFIFANTKAFCYGVADSVELYNFFANNNYATKYQELIDTQESAFPKNVIIRIAPANQTQSQVIFAFTQEFAIKDKESILYFLNSLKEANLPYTATVLLSADFTELTEKNINLFKDTNHLHPTGTEVFTTFAETETICSIVAIESLPNTKQKHYSIVPGGAKEVSPLWLVRTLQTSCHVHNQTATIPKTVAFLYRLGLTEENERVSTFLQQEIPSAGITINNTKEDLDILLSAALNLSTIKNTKWDKHYSYVQVPFLQYSFWINEALYTTNYLLITCVILFLLCFVYFSNTNKNNAAFYDLKKTWYLTPIFIAITTLVLIATQYLVLQINQINKLLSDNILYLLGIKLFTSVLFSLIFFTLQEKFNFKSSFKASSYLMMCIATMNIFLFCFIDLTLLFLFFFEYCICYFAHKTQKPFFTALTLILLFVPFVMPAINIMSAANELALKEFVCCSYFGNFLCACIIYPLQIQWKRLLISTGIFNKKIIFKRKQFLYSTLFIIFSVSVFATGYILFSGFVTATGVKVNKNPIKSITFFNLQKKQKQNNIVLSKTNPPYRTKVEVSSEPFMELNINCISIDFLQQDNSYVLRQEISVESDNNVPIYESNYSYLFVSENKISFRIPDYPANKFDIMFSCTANTKNIITVTTWIKNTDGSIQKEIQQLTVNNL